MTSFELHRLPARSMGLKLITVGVLALLMTIPAWFVDNLVDDRSQREADVSQEIGGVLGGSQIFLGPVMAVPYTSLDSSGLRRVDQGIYVIFPTVGDADVVTKSEVRRRSLFKVPVYSATIEFTATYDLTSSPVNLPQLAELDWKRAEIITGASDSRGALADATITSGGVTRPMAPSGLVNYLPINAPNTPQIGLKIFGLPVGTTVGQNSKFDLAATMKFSGSQKLTILPFGKTSGITVRGNWANPGFDGGFLPVSQSVSPTGFQAHWSIPFIARGIGSEGKSDLIANLLPLAPVVDFVELANPYQSVTRSLKYVLLFLCLVFSAFFIFETTTGKRVHPAQYFLIGTAQLIFYLLLLSIAERIGFDAAFAIASTATVSLISVNAAWIFESRRLGLRAVVVFSMVYGLIYTLLTLEDEALLVGSAVSFFAIAAIMYFTRSINWYSQESSRANSSPDPALSGAR